jgi:hypothetical protein
VIVDEMRKFRHREFAANLVPTARSVGEAALARLPWLPSREPVHSDRVSAGWLGARLGAGVPGAELLGVDTLAHSPGTTDHRRLALHWNTAGASAGLPDRVFVKSTSSAARNRTMAAMLRLALTELDFYERLAPEIPQLAPRAYAGVRGHGGRFLLVMEDLGDGRAQLFDVAGGCTVADAEDALTTLARLHARYWASPRFDSDLQWLRPQLRRHGLVLNHRFHDAYRDAALANAELPWVVPDDVRGLIEQLPEIRWVIDRWWHEAGPAMVCHGDAQLSNTYRDSAGVVRLLDWQLVHRAHGMRDVATFLASGLPIEVRRAHDRDLLERYRVALAEAGVPDPPSAAALWELYRLFLVHVLGAAVVGMAFAGVLSVDGEARVVLNERRLAAVADLEVADYVARRLAREGMI